MRTSLISIPTATTPLDGLLYEPDDRWSGGTVQVLHGQAMNFYVGVSRFLPPVLAAAGYSCLAYNRRSHDALSTRDDPGRQEGAAYVTIAQAREDDETARRWLLDNGHSAPHIVGHSFGGLLAAAYAVAHPETPSLSLLSPVRGGGDFIPAASRNGLVAGDRLEEFAWRAKELVAGGAGDQLMPLPGWWHIISAAAFLDLLENAPDLLELAPDVRARTLALRGSLEPAAVYPIEDFADKAGGDCKIAIVEGANHFYTGCEAQAAELILANISQPS